jgi:hypothetical protein
MFFADGRIVVDANVELDCNRKNANIHARLGFIIGISIHGLREARPSIVNIIAEIIHVPSALVKVEYQISRFCVPAPEWRSKMRA